MAKKKFNWEKTKTIFGEAWKIPGFDLGAVNTREKQITQLGCVPHPHYPDNNVVAAMPRELVPEEVRKKHPGVDFFDFSCGNRGAFFEPIKLEQNKKESLPYRLRTFDGRGPTIKHDIRALQGMEDEFDFIPKDVLHDMLENLTYANTGISFDPSNPTAITEKDKQLRRVIEGTESCTPSFERELFHVLQQKLKITPAIRQAVHNALHNLPDQTIQQSAKKLEVFPFLREWQPYFQGVERGRQPDEMIEEYNEAKKEFQYVLAHMDFQEFSYRLLHMADGMSDLRHIVETLISEQSLPPIPKDVGTKSFGKKIDKLGEKMTENGFHMHIGQRKLPDPVFTSELLQTYHNLFSPRLKKGESPIEALFLSPGKREELRHMLSHFTWTMYGAGNRGRPLADLDKEWLNYFRKTPLAMALGQVRDTVGFMERMLGQQENLERHTGALHPFELLNLPHRIRNIQKSFDKRPKMERVQMMQSFSNFAEHTAATRRG